MVELPIEMRGPSSPSRGRGKSIRLTGSCACALKRIYVVNPTASRTFNVESPAGVTLDVGTTVVSVGPVSLHTPPEHGPTAGGGRQPAHPAGADAGRHPDGCPAGLAAPGAVPDGASTDWAGSTTSAARARSCKWGWLYQTDGRPATSGPPVSYLPGTYVEEITSPRMLRSSTRTPRRIAEESRA